MAAFNKTLYADLDGTLLGPGGSQDYWRHPEFDELGNAARFSVDEKFRGDAYKKMTQLFLEHFTSEEIDMLASLLSRLPGAHRGGACTVD